ncbi:MAG: sulfatase activating formylglycine-generating enzyme, partial [bacterium]
TGKKLQYKNRALSQDELKFSMVIKGGSYGSAAKHLDPRFRSVSQIVYQSRFLGFRCVKKP